MASSIPASARAEAPPAVRASRARRTRWMALGGGAFVLVLIVAALAAPVIAPHDPVRQSLRARLAAPTLAGADGKAYLLGTDHLGRDVLSRTIHGARVSLLVGFAAVLVGGIVGASLGLLAGFRGGWVDSAIMTLADAQLAFPFILLAIGIIAVLGPSFPTLIVVIGLSGWVTYARVPAPRCSCCARASSSMRSTRSAARWPGDRAPHFAQRALVARRHRDARAGPGDRARGDTLVPRPRRSAPTPSWGGMVHEGREYLDSARWISTSPGIVLMLTSIIVSRTGDWLRDLLDPTLRGE